jgi:peptidoglycan/xylan/chitin deacetylase (PgdA/CDA1 family)
MLFKLIADRIFASLNLRVFLPLLAAALASTWYGLFWSVEHFAGLTDGLRLMDMQPRLTVDLLFANIATYDPEATRFYLWWSLFDYAWPFITFTTMLFISAWLCQFADARWRRGLPWFVAFAYLTVAMDWAENVGFASLVILRPDGPLWLAQLTLALHAGKLIFNMLFNLAFWVLLLTVIVRRGRALF